MEQTAAVFTKAKQRRSARVKSNIMLLLGPLLFDLFIFYAAFVEVDMTRIGSKNVKLIRNGIYDV